MREPDDIQIDDDAGERPARIVVVVDVMRAFTTAAAALDAGASAVLCVSSVDEALDARRGRPAALLAGERWGLAPAGFRLANSPREMTAPRVAGALVILVSQNGRPVSSARTSPPGRWRSRRVTSCSWSSTRRTP